MAGTERLGDIKGVLFDMDGLLIDSEIVYTIVVNQILAPYGKEQTWEIKSRLMGMPEHESVEVLLSSLWPPSSEEQAKGLKWAQDCPLTIDSFLKHRNADLAEYFSKVKPMPGAVRLVKHLARHNVPICVATGSKRENFQVKSMNNQELFAPFNGRVICGDDERLKRGKPHPDVFLLAAREALGFRQGVRDVGPAHDGTFGGQEESLLVFEDARQGVMAANAAGMKVVWVPDENLLRTLSESGETLLATQTLSTLEHFKPEQWGLPPFDDDVNVQ